MRLNTLAVLFLAIHLVACSKAPPCPGFEASEAVSSAGCLAYRGQSLLLVQGPNGAVSVPGGSANVGESGRCTAFRETWEETGLEVEPRQLVRAFDNGFHLYQCEVTGWPDTFVPPFRLEIKQVLLLDRGNFSQYRWRFPEQQQWLADWLQASE